MHGLKSHLCLKILGIALAHLLKPPVLIFTEIRT